MTAITFVADEFNSSILEFLKKEHECFNKNLNENICDIDVESIFEEINRLSDRNDVRDVDEILLEVEVLMKNQNLNDEKRKILNTCSITSNSESSLQTGQNMTKKQKDSAKTNAMKIKTGVIEITKSKLSKNETDNINNSSSSLKHKIECTELIFNKTNNLGDLNTKQADIKDILKINPSSNNVKRNKIEFQTELNDYKEKRKVFNNNSPLSPPNNLNKNKCIANSIHCLYSEQICTRKFVDSNKLPDHLVTSVENICVEKTAVENICVTKEYALKLEIAQLQEKLKDTEERLQSLKIQYDSLSQLHRDLRENNLQIQVKSEHLKLEVQNLTECANILRSELKAARNDRNAVLKIRSTLQTDYDKCKNEKKELTEQNEKHFKVIQDLQRQCKEMEKILMRKHPDSISALIVASKNSSQNNEDPSVGRYLLEQRIAQLEADAKRQDIKAQKILANVQAKFISVQAKYETHIADLETQVLSLQEINTKLNEKIEFQIATLNNFVKSNDSFKSSFTQTDDFPEREDKMITTSIQTNLKFPPKSSGYIGVSTGAARKTLQSKIPSSYLDQQISAYHSPNKEDAHLLATIRGMRVDLAIKDKAMQRLTKELDECRKTIKKLQKEKEAEKSNTSRKFKDSNHNSEQHNISDSQMVKEARNKIKLLEFDYKALHDKRLQDLKTLQAAHERELASCHETAQILQQRLTERDEAFVNQKRRKIPIDYYALKAKVSSLERRHSEREHRLHMLVEALSKGRFNGALKDMLPKNN